MKVVLDVVPGLGDLLTAHSWAGPAVGVGIGGAVVAFWVYLAMDAKVSEAEGKVSDLGARLGDVQLERDRLRSELEDARREVVPHDRELFKVWLDLFPPGGEIRVWLRTFYARKWSTERERKVEQFLMEWVDRGFTDQELHALYKKMYDAAVAFERWLGDHGFQNETAPRVTGRMKPPDQALLTEFYAEGQRGEGLATTLADAAAAFEQYAHSRGL